MENMGKHRQNAKSWPAYEARGRVLE